jgi:hypothetical protein
MKTPEEIKKGLYTCIGYDERCANCSYVCYGDCRAALEVDALKYIHQLEFAQPKWISVEERLPGGVCITRNDVGATLIGRVSKCQHREAYRCDDEHGVYAMFDVTHWMPLPEPPKEEA